MKIELSREQRRELETLVTSPTTRIAHARRARVVLLSADGVSGTEIARQLSLSSGQVSRIRGRFRKGGVVALSERPRPGRRDHAASAEQVALVLSLRASPAPEAGKGWSTRRIAAQVGLTSATVAKLLREHAGSNCLAQRG